MDDTVRLVHIGQTSTHKFEAGDTTVFVQAQLISKDTINVDVWPEAPTGLRVMKFENATRLGLYQKRDADMLIAVEVGNGVNLDIGGIYNETQLSMVFWHINQIAEKYRWKVDELARKLEGEPETFIEDDEVRMIYARAKLDAINELSTAIKREKDVI